jgi:tetratricopeptide (TPR) repeat protein
MRRGEAAALAVALLAATPLPAGSGPVDQARGLVLSGERARAADLLDSLLTAPGAAPGVLEEAGYLRAVLETDTDLLSRRLRLYLQGDPPADRRAGAALILGKLVFSQGDYTQALGHFRSARDHGRREEGSLWAGMAAAALGDGPAAVEDLEAASRSGSPDIRERALLVLGTVHRNAGRPSEALAWYGQIPDREDGAGWWSAAALLAGECHEILGEPGRAAEVYRGLLAVAPHAYEAPLARARLDRLAAPAPGSSAPLQPGGLRFALQVGAFASETNAASLAETLRSSDLPDVRVISGEGGIHRVLVGSFGDRAEAERWADSLLVATESGYRVVTVPERP